MIGKIITDKDGNPLDNMGNKLSPSNYNPSEAVKRLFARVQTDYQVAYALQHRPFDEFDGYSLLVRSRMDQQTFAAFVGAEYVPVQKQWRFRGRKNTARNKIIGILSQLITGMLYPYVSARNDQNEDDKMTAQVMRILIENHLQKAKYEMRFLNMVLTALVNPAVHVEVEYVEAMQRIKTKLADGSYKVVEAVDEMISGLNLNLIPIGDILIGDFFIGDVQRQPFIIRVRRISYDEARAKYEGKNIVNGVDQFSFVSAGKTRVFLTGQENQTLFDIEWTESDAYMVQEITAYYRGEDLQVTFVGGVFMGNETDIYNSNPFEHRRFTKIGKEWMTIPVYPYAKTYFEPVDPTGRFYYGKSAAFKEYWDDRSVNLMFQLLHDGTYLDVIKPLFISGMQKVDSIVIAPGSTTAMPKDASILPYSISPNISAAYQALNTAKGDMSESTVDKVLEGQTGGGKTAYEISQAIKNARIVLGTFGIMIADLIQQVGMLTMDCVINYATIPELETLTSGDVTEKFKTYISKGKDKGKSVTNKVVFTMKYSGRKMTKEQLDAIEWDLYDKAGGHTSDERIFLVNPYQFARFMYSLSVDAEEITRNAIGADRQEKIQAFTMLTDPRVAPFTDRKAVVDDFVIDEYGGTDPDKYKTKQTFTPDMLNQMMGSQNSNSSMTTSPLGTTTTTGATG